MGYSTDASVYYYFSTLLQGDGGDGKERRQTCFCVEVRMDPTNTPGSEILNRDELSEQIQVSSSNLFIPGFSSSFHCCSINLQIPPFLASDSRLGELQKG